jgi:hypothetical protein
VVKVPAVGKFHIGNPDVQPIVSVQDPVRMNLPPHRRSLPSVRTVIASSSLCHLAA